MKDIMIEIQLLVTACRRTLKSALKSADEETKEALERTLNDLDKCDSLLESLLRVYSSSSKEIRNVTKEMIQMDQWVTEKSHYKVFRLQSGWEVIIEKGGRKSPYEKDWYCKKCFENFKIVQLHLEEGLLNLSCTNGCEPKVRVTGEELELLKKAELS